MSFLQVVELGPSCSGRVKEGMRVVAVPWRAKEGEGTWQQYTLVDEAALVCISMHPAPACNSSRT